MIVRNSSPVIIVVVVVVVVSRTYDFIPGTDDFGVVACLDQDNDLQACRQVVYKDRCVYVHADTGGVHLVW